MAVGCSLTLGDLQSFLTAKWELREGREGGGSNGGGGEKWREGEGGGDEVRNIQPLTLYHSYGTELSRVSQGQPKSSNSSVGNTGTTSTDPVCRCVCPTHRKTLPPHTSVQHRITQYTVGGGGGVLKTTTDSGGNRESLVVQQSQGQESDQLSTVCCTCTGYSSSKANETVGNSDSSRTETGSTGFREDQGEQVYQSAVDGVHQIPDLLSEDNLLANPPIKLDWSFNTTLSSIHTMV